VAVLLTNIRYAFRWLWRSPGFTAVAVLSLGLGVGANTAMFSLVDSLLLRPLPVADPDTLVDVFTAGGDGDVHATSSFRDFQDLKAANTVFSDMIGYSPMFAALGLGERSRLVLGQVVTSNHFQVLGVQPERGRLLQAADDAPGADSRRGAVASHVGTRVLAGGRRRRPHPAASRPAVHHRRRRACGVHGRHAALHARALAPGRPRGRGRARGHDRRRSRTGHDAARASRLSLDVREGRLKPGIEASAAAANVQLIGARLAASFPDTNKDRAMSAVPTRDVRLFVLKPAGT
jgi:hypothetical protein